MKKSGAKIRNPLRKKVNLLLTGEHNHSVDPKGRIIIPSKFREELSEGFTITKGLDNCLFLYPNNEWNQFRDNLLTLKDTTNKDARLFKRFFLGSAESGSLDKQGRVLLSQTLRNFAGLEKDIVLVGMLERIEIWDKARWDENNAAVEENMDDIAARLQELGLNI